VRVAGALCHRVPETRQRAEIPAALRRKAGQRPQVAATGRLARRLLSVGSMDARRLAERRDDLAEVPRRVVMLRPVLRVAKRRPIDVVDARETRT